MIIYDTYFLTQLVTGNLTKRMCTQITIVLTAKFSISYSTNIIFEERKQNKYIHDRKNKVKKIN